MMRLLFCSKSYPIFGGVERWLSDLCKHLPGYGYETIIALEQGSRFNNARAYHSAYPHLNVVTMKSLTGTAVGRRLAAESVIRKVKPDIVIPVLAHDAYVAAVTLKALGNKHRIVYAIHELNPAAFGEIREYSPDTDMVVCVNRLSMKICQMLCGVSPERIRHIRCGVPLPLKTETRACMHSIHIGFVGRLQQIQKRIFDLQKLCEELDRRQVSFKLSIAGAGFDEDRLIQLLDKYIRSGKVIFRGQMTNEQLSTDFYPRIDALIITSEWETGPIVAWEAMANGTAIITSSFRGLKAEDTLRHNKNALVFDIGDMSQAAEHVLALMNNKALIQELGQAGRQTAQEYLTLEEMIIAWRDLLAEVLTRNPIKSGNVPSMPSQSGRLEKWGIPIRFSEFLRKIAFRRFIHSSVRAEWPFYAECDQDFSKSFYRAVIELDRAGCLQAAGRHRANQAVS